MEHSPIAIIGAGNLGVAIANGLVESGNYLPEQIILTRRNVHLLDGMQAMGFVIERDNREAVRKATTLIIAVEPTHIDNVLSEIAPHLLPDRHLVISVVSGTSIERIHHHLGKEIAVVRAMPNTAIAVGESMTCLASANRDIRTLEVARAIFDSVGKTIVIDEEQMSAATALAASGVAFFLRAIRAASQGGIEIGFDAADATAIAAQVARGAATLLLTTQSHPEVEIDKVTTPKGCTIAGLNQMEQDGFSAAMIRGIAVAAKRAGELYSSMR